MTKATAKKTASEKSAVPASKPASKKSAPAAKDVPVAEKKPAAAKKTVTAKSSAPTAVDPTAAPTKAVTSNAAIPEKKPAKVTVTTAPKAKEPAAAPKTTEPPKAEAKASPPPAPTPRAASPFAAPSTSRFADRFAPPRPISRAMSNLSQDIPRPSPAPDPKLANAWKSKAGRDLTEEELLAMPDSEYMNEKQLDFFRARLIAQKENLLSNAGETTEHLREDTSIVPDPADRATIEEEHALELRTRDRERKLLKKISQSLLRIESGDYGFCDETGEPIGLGRLIARPTATLSLEAQQRRELKQKMFGD